MSIADADTEQRVTAGRVAEVLDCSLEKVYRMARLGEIPSERIGRAYRFRISAVTEALSTKKTSDWTQSRRSTARRRRA